MKGQSGEYMRLRRFLLGELPEEEREAIERGFFPDAQLFELLKCVEDELIDEYARGVLKGDERKRWEEVLCADGQARFRVRFAGVLSRRLGPGTSWVSRWQSWPVMVRILAPVAVAVLLLIGFVSFRNKQSGKEVVTGDRKAPEAVFAFALAPGTVRGAEGQQVVVVPPSAGVLRITFQSAGEASTVEIRNVDSGAKASFDLRGGVVEAEAGRFAAGDYVATLFNDLGEELADYSFRIRRQ